MSTIFFLLSLCRIEKLILNVNINSATCKIFCQCLLHPFKKVSLTTLYNGFFKYFFRKPYKI